MDEKIENRTDTKRMLFEEKLKIFGISDSEFLSFFEPLYRICIYKVIAVIPCLVYPIGGGKQGK